MIPIQLPEIDDEINPYEKITVFSERPFLAGGWTNPSEKYARQIGSFPQVGVKINNIWNHHLDLFNGRLRPTESSNHSNFRCLSVR